ncbi:MAG: OmpA family protein [Eudoraea sp.]
MKKTNNLVVLFLCSAALVLSSCVSKKTYTDQVQATNDAVETADAYSILNQELSAALSDDDAQIENDQIQISDLKDQLKVTLVNSIVFSEGGYVVNSTGKATLAKIAPSLAKLTDQQIVVQGFTDNESIGPKLAKKYATNLELSSARADNVVNYLISKGVPSSIISAQGFGEQRAVAPNDTEANKAKNRRVEIIVKAKSQK